MPWTTSPHIPRKSAASCWREREEKIGPVLDRNFDRRASIYQISAQNLEMIRRARETGASAKFAGSGGAIIGTYPDEDAYCALQRTLAAIGATVIKPEIA